MWEELVDVMKGLLKIYQKLLELSEEKRTALVTVQIKDLERIVQEEQTLINVIAKLEERRRTLLESLAQTYRPGQPAENLDEVLSYCKSGHSSVLAQTHKDLRAAIHEIAKRNDLNTTLTKQALAAVDYKLNVLTNSSVGPTYADRGKEQITRPKRLDFEA